MCVCVYKRHMLKNHNFNHGPSHIDSDHVLLIITDILSKVRWTALNKTTTHLTKRFVRVKSVITISGILTFALN